MKTIAWNKLPVNKIFGKNNIWTKMAKTFEKDKSTPIDFKDMETLFCLVAPKPPDAGEKKGEGGGAERKKKSDEINLLDGKRSLNINIFLRQFRRWVVGRRSIRLNLHTISPSPSFPAQLERGHPGDGGGRRLPRLRAGEASRSDEDPAG
jgi:hypothetical protein